MNKMDRMSFFFLIALLVLVGWLHLATPLITILFSYFALSRMDQFKRKWPAALLFVILVLAALSGFGYFVKKAVHEAWPAIRDKAIPAVTDWASRHNVDLPFTDLDSLKTVLKDTVRDEAMLVGNFARLASKQFLFLLIGLVVAVSLFMNQKISLEERLGHDNLYQVACDRISQRFRGLYRSFEIVMGAQIIISSINAALSAIFIFGASLPYGGVAIVVTFLCGLLPIIGNIISNTFVVALAFTKSPQLALFALAFLVVIHKLEYFLNSKIIGGRIKNPVWLTLLALVLGERLMGIPGMILAPVVLHYLKTEASRFTAPAAAAKQAPQPESAPAPVVIGGPDD